MFNVNKIISYHIISDGVSTAADQAVVHFAQSKLILRPHGASIADGASKAGAHCVLALGPHNPPIAIWQSGLQAGVHFAQTKLPLRPHGPPITDLRSVQDGLPSGRPLRFDKAPIEASQSA